MGDEPGAQELILFIGLQGSGKTTFYRTHLAETHALVSKDRFRHNRHKAHRQLVLVAEALSAGRSVVVDNTNPTEADRADVITLAKSHGARVVAYFFPPDVTASLRRNSGRTGKAYVPAVGIFGTAKRLQWPSLAEGFDAIVTVLTGDHGDFTLLPGLPPAECFQAVSREEPVEGEDALPF
jgi:predicted kinase